MIRSNGELLFYVAFAPLAFIWVGITVMLAPKHSETGAWQETPCTITRSEVEEYEHRDDGRSETRYAPRVEHKYSYGGREYRGNRYTRDGKCFSETPGLCYRVANKYPAGSEQVCYVNPDRPSEAVLWRESDWEEIAFGFWGVFTMLLFLHCVFRRFWRGYLSPVRAQAPVYLPNPRHITVFTILATLGASFIIVGAPVAIASFFYLDGANPLDDALYVFIAMAPWYIYLAALNRRVFSDPRLTVKVFPFPVLAGEDFEVEWRFRGSTARLKKLTITLKCTKKRGLQQRYRLKTITIFESEDPLAFAQGKALCSIPADARPSGKDGDAKVIWKLCFHGVIPTPLWFERPVNARRPTSPDVREEFEVPVVPGRNGA